MIIRNRSKQISFLVLFQFQTPKNLSSINPKKKRNKPPVPLKKGQDLNSAGFFGDFLGGHQPINPQVEADWLLFGCGGDPSGMRVTESPAGEKSHRFGTNLRSSVWDDPNVGRTEIAGGTRVILDISSPQSMMNHELQSWG